MEFGIESGETVSLFARPQYYQEAKYTAVLVRSSGPVFYEYIQGGWFGESDGRFLGGSLGIKTESKWFVEGTAGVVHLFKPQPDNLDGSEQFNLSFGLGYQDEVSVLLKIRHFSNGCYVKGCNINNNNGMDFILFNVIVRLN